MVDIGGHVAESRGLFDLDSPVADYWPEFAQQGKEVITVRQLLQHEAGLAVIDSPLDIDTIADPSAFRFGFMKPFPILDFGTSERAFGRTGSGGSFAYADPAIGLGYAYVMNRAGYGLPTDPRETSLREAVAVSIA